jgi:hypothetical protein
VAEAAVEEDVEAVVAGQAVAADLEEAVAPLAATAAERDPVLVPVARLLSVNRDPVHRAAA